MPRSMADPNYVRQYWSDEHRQRISLAHKRRLGVPDDCVRIYGIDVPAQFDKPLRNYASYVNQKKGRKAAEAYIWTVLGRGRINKPSPNKYKVTDRNYIYRPLPSTTYRRIAELSASKPLLEEGVLLYGIRVPASRKLCMARNGDEGPYAPWNVHCCTGRENQAEITHESYVRRGTKSAATRRLTNNFNLAVRGAGHPRARRVMTPKGVFESGALAAEYYGVSKEGLYHRVRSGWPGYQWLDSADASYARTKRGYSEVGA